MHQTVAGESHAVHVPLAENLLVGIALTRKSVEARSMLVWGEHCTECVMPSCYASCALYTPRQDLKCRRFDQGIVPVRSSSSGEVLGMRVSFRKWGKLEAEGRLSAVSLQRSQALTIADRMIGTAIGWLPSVRRLPHLLATTWNRLKTRFAASGLSPSKFQVFLIECICESTRGGSLTLTVKPRVSTGRYFQHHFEVISGYNRIEIPANTILGSVNIETDLVVQIEPVDVLPENSFIFTFADFALLKGTNQSSARPDPAATADLNGRPMDSARKSAATCKCVVWDLDNTLWAGTLIEDGVENLRLNQTAVQVIKDLDQRGILHSIASKNNAEEALAALEHFGIREYFLVPQISGGPKSAAIGEIARRLNIGKDSLLFIDDQPFERAEVESVHANVRVLSHTSIAGLLELPEFDVPITEEGRRRRVMYIMEEQREHVFRETGADFIAFLKSCRLEITISELNASNIDRVYELAQRTNQLNYAGRKASRQEIESLFAEGGNARMGYALGCSDKFGDYGIVGFAIVDQQHFNVDDFFMSCRVQHKKVDHAFFGWLLQKARARGVERVTVSFRSTGRNEPARQVLNEMNFEELENANSYISPTLDELPHWDIVAVQLGPRRLLH
jgi:FkbH-like protein